MKKTLIAFVTLATLVGCKTSPTGRTQIALYSDTQMNKMGVQSFEQLKADKAINTDVKINRYVQCVADNVISVLPTKYTNQQWEVVVFEDDSANAFALPGGKIGVHTGLLKIAANQDQLATVLGHEVGHVIAEHSNERASQGNLLQYSMQATSAVLQTQNVKYQNEIMSALGMGAQYGVVLPFSRTHETEADSIGLDLMAKAGFNPKESVTLWQNMSKEGSGATPEFLSTHPAPTSRISELRSKMPDAMKFKNVAAKSGLKPGCKL
ncbi:M48 family metallopeptidase [Pseudoalteromonas denitrificans]|uniref:Peptidase family M48 n=1 Tax=Pseudoalteromonas denitrificans DSM 6059 TaxID=1123010 RepID=A0A1I1NK49_9GAMM|nr:M48 family metallopeptidase [Pseudoalteromonas denitrificans]SFC94090.1 Peptidase family M48 [Pseudoalteromonas denitrificans DSM 6059]